MNFKEIEDKIYEDKKYNPTYWGCALSGEIGEITELLLSCYLSNHSGLACNLLKKQEMSQEEVKNKLKYELALCFNSKNV